MNTVRIIVPSLVLYSLLLLGGCKENQEDSIQRQLLDARTERTELLNDLYEDYGGGFLAGIIKGIRPSEESIVDWDRWLGPPPWRPSEESIGDMLKRLVTETDRGAFEVDVDIVGNGERVTFFFNEVAKRFFARNDVKDKCRKVVELSQRISRLERELAALRAGKYHWTP